MLDNSEQKKKNSFQLIALAIIFTLSLFYLSIEIPRVINEYLLGFYPDIHPVLEPERVESFIAFLMPIGLICLAIVVILIFVGFYIEKRKITSLGSFLLFLPSFGHFVAAMLFLAGIGILQVMYLPLLNSEYNILDLGFVINVPILTLDIFFNWIQSRSTFTNILRNLIVFSGLLIFVLGVLAWFNGKRSRSGVYDSSVYKYSRHPQYLGFLIWSYGIHSLSFPVYSFPMGANWISYSLPWLFSALIVVSVAFFEDIKMNESNPEVYGDYRSRTQFLIPLPKFVRNALLFPLKKVFKKDFPENGKEIFFIILFYGGICVLISFILILFNIDELLNTCLRELWYS
ncbi:MAG: DUF1295 domain-containing protein [Promethearchaeota archaeon]